MSDSNKVIGIIPFFNGDQYIAACLKSLMENSEDLLEVIIVNNSNAPTKVHQIVEDFRKVTIVDTDARIGFGRACNLGARISLERGADYLICLNQDVIIEQNLISRLIKPLKEFDDVALSAPIAYSNNFAGIESFFVKWYLSQCPDLIYDALNSSLKTQYQVERVCGACFAIRIGFIEKYGFFDPLYFMYAEDDDLCRRISYLGYKIVFIPAARFIHHSFNLSKDRGISAERGSPWQHHSNAVFQLKDVNSSFIRVFFKLLSKDVFDYMSLVIRFKFSALYCNLIADIKILFALPQIIKGRRIESKLLLEGAARLNRL